MNTDTQIMLDDKEVIWGAYSSVCSFCKKNQQDYSCKAFGVNGIPENVWKGENDHTKPIDGDNGLQFEKREA